MTRAVFIVSKDPFGTVQDGETRVTRLLVDAAGAACEVGVLALSDEPGRNGSGVDVTRVPKPPVRFARLALESAVRRRSLIHTRFAPRSLSETLEDVPADVLVARRVYMAQAALDAGRVPPRDRLAVLVDVLESMVMRRRQSPLRPLLGLESRRTRRDEIRCVRAASDVAYLSDTELRELGGSVGGARRRLDLTLPPAEQPAGLEGPVALFVGDRRWPPNAEALSKLLALWPGISEAAPRARLLVVGRAARRESLPLAPTVQSLGFVDDLDSVWRSTAVLLAPVSIGGGVRVKVLDAARHGVPIVGSPEAIGSTGDYLPVRPQASDEEFVARAAELLADLAERREHGQALFEANSELNARGFVEEQVADLLTGPRSPEPAG